MDRERLQLVLECLISDGSRTKTELQKLVYLFERESFLTTGEGYLSMPYKSGKFGMFSSSLADEVDALVDRGFLLSRSVPADEGEGARYRLAKPRRGGFNPQVEAICGSLLRQHARGGLSGLIASAKATEPFKSTPRGQSIDWAAFGRCQCPPGTTLQPEFSEELRLADESTRAGRGRLLTKDQALQELAE